jgi:ribA/ribD-fused uncharacterized protein
VQIKDLKEQAQEMGRAAIPATPAAPAAAAAEDSPADSIDLGQPERNNVAGANVVPSGGNVLEFNNEKKTPYSEFGTYYKVKLSIDGAEWPSAEHYFQAMKFPENLEYQKQIREAKEASAARTLGIAKPVQGVVRKDWETYRDTVMMTINREKFSDAHPELKQMLISTGDAELHYNTPQDNYWGLGRKGEGRNKLGKILMEIRAELAPKAPPMEANEKIIVTNIPPPVQAVPVAAAPAPPPVVNIQVVNQQQDAQQPAEQVNALNVAASMLENQNAPPPPSSGLPRLTIEEGDGQPLNPVEAPGAVGGGPGPDTSQVKVITIDTSPAPKN